MSFLTSDELFEKYRNYILNIAIFEDGQFIGAYDNPSDFKKDINYFSNYIEIQNSPFTFKNVQGKYVFIIFKEPFQPPYDTFLVTMNLKEAIDFTVIKKKKLAYAIKINKPARTNYLPKMLKLDAYLSKIRAAQKKYMDVQKGEIKYDLDDIFD